MTQFLKEEMVRLVDLIPQTDPRTGDYITLLHAIECLDSMGSTVDEIVKLALEDGCGENQEQLAAGAAKVIQLSSAIKATAETGDRVAPFTAPEFPEAPSEPVTGAEVEEKAKPAPVTVQNEEPSAKTYTGSEVRKALVDARGRGVDVRALMAELGAENFAAVPAARYGELMKKLEVVG